MKRKIALIAGTGKLPLDACDYLSSQEDPFFIISLFPDDNGAELKGRVHPSVHVITESVYKAGTILNILKSSNTTDVLFIGKVDKQNLLKNISLDWLALKLLAQTVVRSDKQLLEIVIAELKKHTINVISQHSALHSLLVPPGLLSGSLNENIRHDIDIGMKIALTIAHADIGQTVVIKDGMVLAIEAIEGTDACIKRGIELGKKNVVICKSARSDHNPKYDLPTLGPQTLASINRGEIAAIAWQSDKTLIAQKSEFIKIARDKRIVLVSV